MTELLVPSDELNTLRGPVVDISTPNVMFGVDISTLLLHNLLGVDVSTLLLHNMLGVDVSTLLLQ
jgi:hypothetical protein